MKMENGHRGLHRLDHQENNMNKDGAMPYLLVVLISLLLCLSFFSCSILDLDNDKADESDILFSELEDVDDWTDETHGKLETEAIKANMDQVFNTSDVQKLRVVIEPDNWELMNDNLDDLKDELGNSTDFNSVDDPFFVPCNVFYSPDGADDNEKQWYKVGIRFKGNSSLYNANSNKLPFKLDFDEFEDTYEQIKNQRFYGFKQLNLKNNYEDKSEMHEIVVDDLFRDFQLVSPHASFYELYLNVDGGDESDDIYYGLYTLVEEVDDTVISTQYDDDSGNLYKPEDDAASFEEGTYDEDEYGLKTDDDESYEDIRTLYEAINNTESSTWKTDLEAIFDVDIFLRWLAANSVLQNWDTYGVMTHNYYLYHNPGTGTFEWIPWDNNEALISSSRCLDLDMEKVDDKWPLIRNILDDSDYEAVYKEYVEDFASTLFNESYLNPIFETYKKKIKDFVSQEVSGYTFTSTSKFTSAVVTLKDHTGERYAAAIEYASDL